MDTFIQNGDKFSIASLSGTHEKLPKGNYILNQNPMSGEYYLTTKRDFSLPSKLYGDYKIIDRWKKSFNNNSEKNMGIILSGTKGTGKTITAKKFCMEMDLPVINVISGYHGQGFTEFITNPLIGDCIIFIDEFEKIYEDADAQKHFLSLMDGNFHSRLIFLLTVNEFTVNSYLVNRLNRIKYRKHYGDLDLDLVAEVLDDLLINKAHSQSVYEFFQKVNMWTFDLLVNIIKEVNLFDEDALTCGSHLNLETTKSYYAVYEIVNGIEHPCSTTRINPTQPSILVEREKTDYITPKLRVKNKVTSNEEDEDDDDTSEYEYIPMRFNLKMSECELHREGPDQFIVISPEFGKFRFIRDAPQIMVF